jgi:hypothetical protein
MGAIENGVGAKTSLALLHLALGKEEKALLSPRLP